MLRRSVSLLMSSQILNRDETLVTDGANLSFGTMPAGMMAAKC